MKAVVFLTFCVLKLTLSSNTTAVGPSAGSSAKETFTQLIAAVFRNLKSDKGLTIHTDIVNPEALQQMKTKGGMLRNLKSDKGLTNHTDIVKPEALQQKKKKKKKGGLLKSRSNRCKRMTGGCCMSCMPQPRPPPPPRPVCTKCGSQGFPWPPEYGGGSKICFPPGKPCTDNMQCCNKDCDGICGGQRKPPSPPRPPKGPREPSCKTVSLPCTTNIQCCTNYCLKGQCSCRGHLCDRPPDIKITPPTPDPEIPSPPSTTTSTTTTTEETTTTTTTTTSTTTTTEETTTTTTTSTTTTTEETTRKITSPPSPPETTWTPPFNPCPPGGCSPCGGPGSPTCIPPNQDCTCPMSKCCPGSFCQAQAMCKECTQKRRKICVPDLHCEQFARC